jgi:hypothetical protein
LFNALVAFLKNWAQIKMILLSEIRGQPSRKQPAKGCQTKNETAKIKKWHKLARGIKGKWA